CTVATRLLATPFFVDSRR
ncbi:hypothetical protein V3C99_008789, partial [Haemonchus contortus]